MKTTVSQEVGGRTFSITTGELAKQASGAVLVQLGETAVFVAAQTGPPRPGLDFFPLTVDYRERMAAAGKFPGGFLKREGRPTNREILTCRLTDRPIRPLFPKGFKDEVQVMSTVWACDGINDPDVLSINGASAALCIAPLPFAGPIAAVRVGQIDGEFILFPTSAEMKESRLDLVVAGSEDSILMIEGFAQELPEDEMVDALLFGHKSIGELCRLQKELIEKVNPERVEYEPPPENPFASIVREEAYEKLREARQNPKKHERSAATAAVKEELVERYFPEGREELEDGRTLGQLKEAFYQADKQACRELTLAGKRLDGRGATDLRNVQCEVGILPRVHGSAVFTRGETQAVATLTLGTVRDQQRVDGLFDEYAKAFMLDYNFPPYSVGECRPIRGPGRREIGHGALAERSVAPVVPGSEKFPYTIRIISDITESNGSSSMASVCGATLVLMDAGVPIRQPVAGISIGLVKEGDEYVLLTDIMGDEDHFGDMDFKIAGSQRGITGIQLDLKITGISEEIIRATLAQARDARRELLKTMLTTIRRPRKEMSESAPRIRQTKIDPEKIGLLIGPGGKTIRELQESTKTTIDVDDEGTVTISAANGPSADDALARIEAMTEEIKVGRIYAGRVSSIKDFGAFVEIAPGKDGLLHISELAEGFVKSVADVCKVGDKMEVKVIAVDDQNRVKLSRKAVLATPDTGDGTASGGEE
ncbi:MAG: polyribonucleotide nucleotidyltransferase [Planctomycetota bacterium]|nr:MAG: polyribonucleotide nucleotidyltransferase [Planctomycetota bacterium]REK20205.1 MAG: polyribonucleotide nucleotidyltransferase [Planctomycetota bacterium]REK35341.1 MAG: polyribonucleotide nucleotidyltransferase [Planctomycetota bacterium]